MSLILHADKAHVSPWVFSAFVALKEKQLDFTMKDYVVPEGVREPQFVEESITGKVPVLQHDAFHLAESMAIAEYLAETFPFPKHPRLFPEDLKERGRCRHVMLWLRTDLVALREARPTTSIFTDRPAKTPFGASAEDNAGELMRVASLLLKPGAKTLFGEWCIADADLGLALMRLRGNGDALPSRLATYADAQWERPSVKAWLALPR